MACSNILFPTKSWHTSRLRDPPVSAFQALELKVCATMPNWRGQFGSSFHIQVIPNGNPSSFKLFFSQDREGRPHYMPQLAHYTDPAVLYSSSYLLMLGLKVGTTSG